MNKIYFTIILISFLVFIPLQSLLASDPPFSNTSGVGGGGKTVSLDNPIGETNPNVIIGKIISAILGIVGSLALLMFIYGGLTWMLAAGNNERVQKGKDILVWATIGLVVIFTSYAAVRFIFQGLGL